MSAIKRQQHDVQLWEEAAQNHAVPAYLMRFLAEKQKLDRMIARRERIQNVWGPILLAVLTIVACNYFFGSKP